MCTLVPGGPAYDLVACRLACESLAAYFIVVSDEVLRNGLCDDTSFMFVPGKIRKIISSNPMRSAIMRHPGLEVPEPDVARRGSSGSGWIRRMASRTVDCSTTTPGQCS